VISSAGQPEEQPDLKKPTALRGAVGVWDRESGDRIKGCDGACLHAVWLPRRSWRLEHNQCHSLYLFPAFVTGRHARFNWAVASPASAALRNQVATLAASFWIPSPVEYISARLVAASLDPCCAALVYQETACALSGGIPKPDCSATAVWRGRRGTLRVSQSLRGLGEK